MITFDYNFSYFKRCKGTKNLANGQKNEKIYGGYRNTLYICRKIKVHFDAL